MPRAAQSEEEAELDQTFLRPRKRSAAAEPEEETADNFLRAKKRPPVRKSGIRANARWLVMGFCAFFAITIGTLSYLAVHRYAYHAHRFIVLSSDQIETTPTKNVSRAQMLDVFGADLGRNIFFVPLERRRQQLQHIPWVRTATVMRLLPNRVRVSVTERTPVAFANVSGTVSLVDANGAIMEMPAAGEKFDFPVISGFTYAEPADVRSARMSLYHRLVHDLDDGDAHYSKDISEVDLSEPSDVRIVVSDTNGPVLIHLGTEDFQQRYRFYLDHIGGWRQQFHVKSVDLRYEGQVILNREGQGAEK